MPRTRTAKKRLRQNVKKRAANREQTARMRTEVKKTTRQIEEGQLDQAKDQLKTAMQNIDKAAKKNLIHPNKAARMKSKLAKKLGEASKQ
ncbi:MAG: 30S ribosomal protein S20 [Planctomycetota bacterium]|jgi:small subunit ribosomal protein S20